jgi:MFS family permease
MKRVSRYRWFVFAVFFIFILLHQSDKLLISSLTTEIQDTFGLDKKESMGAVLSGALLVGAFMYPVWGYLQDRFVRPKLIALASFIWGSTTWLSAIARTYTGFLVTRASTGIDDSSYPGLYSLLSDYFEPRMRGKVYGLLQLSQPLGYMLALVAATFLKGPLGWRGVFYVTGSIGLILAALIFFTVRESPRGRTEPELAELDQIGVHRFDWQVAKGLFRKPTMLLLFAQGFVGVIPWNAIVFWFYRYLEEERLYVEGDLVMTMMIAVLVVAVGYFVGGVIGDLAFKRTRRGRILVSMMGVLAGAIFLALTLRVPLGNPSLFLVMLVLTALFIPFAAPNVVSSVYDITLPEVRSTALAIQYFIESLGAAFAPWIVGRIADVPGSSLANAFLLVCIPAWLVGSILLGNAAFLVPRDISVLRRQLQERADQERRLQRA